MVVVFDEPEYLNASVESKSSLDSVLVEMFVIEDSQREKLHDRPEHV